MSRININEIHNVNKRNFIDFSQNEKHSLVAGTILPVQVYDVIAGDSVKHTSNYFMRARPLETAAFAHLQINHDAFFVPYRLLWSGWNTFITQMSLQDIEYSKAIQSAIGKQNNSVGGQDYGSSLSSNISGAPVTGANWTEAITRAPYSSQSLQHPILDVCAFLRSVCSKYPNGSEFNPLGNASVNTPVPYVYPTYNYTTGTFPLVEGTDFIDGEDSIHEMIETCCHRKDATGQNLLGSLLHLFDMLGYGSVTELAFIMWNGCIPSRDIADTPTAPRVPRMRSPFRLLAYYCIMENHFRIDDYEAKINLSNIDILPALSSDWNGPNPTQSRRLHHYRQLLPSIGNGRSVASVANIPDVTMLFGLRPPFYIRDYITDIYPSQLYSKTAQGIFSTIGAPPAQFHSLQNSIVPHNPGYTDGIPQFKNPNTVYAQGYTLSVAQTVTATSGVRGMKPGINDGNTTGPETNSQGELSQLGTTAGGSNVQAQHGLTGTSVMAIKNAEALQRLLEITRRATNTFESQMQAHRGVNYNYGDNIMSPKRLGQSQTSLEINEVVSTADTAQDPDTGSMLGQIAGKGVGAGTLSFEEDFKEFGVVMVLESITALPEYSSFSDPFTSKVSVADYYQPESDRLGMQPLYAFNTPYSGDTLKNSLDFSKLVLGWQPRYAEYKNRYDVVHGGYTDRSNELSHYVVVKPSLQQFRNSVSSQSYTGQEKQFQILYSSLHCMPSSFDSIFQVPVIATDPDTPYNAYNAHFDCVENHEVKMFRPMGISGMPTFSI